MSDRGISLQREEIEREYIKNRGDAFRIRITALDEVLMPRHVFVFQRTLIDPYNGTTMDEFCFIASPFDCTIYPIGDPDPNQFPQFFRKDQIDVLFPSTETAANAWTAIHTAVCNLVDAYNRLDALVLVETVRCGPEKTAEESTSESTSVSTSESS